MDTSPCLQTSKCVETWRVTVESLTGLAARGGEPASWQLRANKKKLLVSLGRGTGHHDESLMARFVDAAHRMD
eukprot:5242004-Prymnesium_polylepis.2